MGLLSRVMATYLGEGNSDIKPGQIGLLSRVMATYLGEGITPI